MRVDELHVGILGGLSGKAKEDFEAGLRDLNMANPADREALRESFKRSNPDWTEVQLDTAVDGRFPPAKVPGTLKEIFIRLGYNEKQADIAAQGRVRGLGVTRPSGSPRDDLEASIRLANPDWTEDQIEIFISGEVKPGTGW